MVEFFDPKKSENRLPKKTECGLSYVCSIRNCTILHRIGTHLYEHIDSALHHADNKTLMSVLCFGVDEHVSDDIFGCQKLIAKLINFFEFTKEKIKGLTLCGLLRV